MSLLRLFWYVTSPIWKNIILRYQIEVQNWANWAIRPNFWVYKEYYYFSTPPFSFWLLIRVIWSTIPMTWLILNFRDFLGKGGRNLGPDKTLGGQFFKKKFFSQRPIYLQQGYQFWWHFNNFYSLFLKTYEPGPAPIKSTTVGGVLIRSSPPPKISKKWNVPPPLLIGQWEYIKRQPHVYSSIIFSGLCWHQV